MPGPKGVDSVHSKRLRHRNVNNLVQIFDDKDKGIDGDEGMKSFVLVVGVHQLLVKTNA